LDGGADNVLSSFVGGDQVSEYVPDVVAYIEAIIARGYAYGEEEEGWW